MKLLQVDFPMDEPFGEEMSEAFKTLRLESFGIRNIRGRIFDVNLPLLLIDRAPLR